MILYLCAGSYNFKKDLLDKIPEPAKDDKSKMASVAKNKDAIVSIVMGLAGLSATVKFGDFIPRAVTGTPTKNVPHIPMGAGFHPAFDKNRDVRLVNFFRSRACCN